MRKLLLLLTTVLGILFVSAQSTANYTFSTASDGSLALDMNSNAIDMSTGTTQIVALGQDDNTGSSLISAIGFDFFLNGTRFSQFSASSNGFMGLGATALATSRYSFASATSALPFIAALGGDLRTGPGGKVHFKLVGAAPNRCLVVEFLNMTTNYGTMV